MLQKGALQEGILQEGVFPTLEGLWLDEQVSSLGGPVSDLLLSLVQALPAHVASSVKLLPNGDVCLVDLPRHWQVLSMQPILPEIEVEAPVFFRRMVASSNVKVSTSEDTEYIQTATSQSRHHRSHLNHSRSPVTFCNTSGFHYHNRHDSILCSAMCRSRPVLFCSCCC